MAAFRALYEPRALVRHASSTTSNRLGDFERGVLFERNALQTALKNFEQLAESGAAVLFAYLHRLHHYATTRNRSPELTRPAMGKKKTSRWKRQPLASIDDPLTTMQFRALDWIFRNQERIAKKRHDVQGRRKRSDREIFERFPLHFVPTYPGDESLMRSALFQLLRPQLPSVEKALGEIMKA